MGLLFFVLTMAALTPFRGGHATPLKVLILPLNLYAPAELAYLTDGIMATLSNRFQRFATPIIPTEAMKKALADLSTPYTSDTAQTVGASLGATHAVTGSVTIVGDAVSTDIQLWRLPEGTALTTFHAGGERPETLLAHLDAFIHQVETTIFDLTPPSPTAPSRISATQMAREPPPVSWRSEPLDTHLTGMTVAQLDSQPEMEIALIDDENLRICRRKGDSLETVQRLEGAPFLRLIAVDAADINGDGAAEVFVSAYHTRLGEPRSFVVEWDPEERLYTKRFENLSTYFRTIASPSKGPRLVGQKKGFDAFFGGLPVTMRWHEGQYAIDTPLALPSETNLYEFVQGPFLPGKTDAIVTLSRKKQLELYTTASEKRWSSEASFGGGSVYLDEGGTPENRAKQLKRVAEETIKRHYLHPRMLMEDLDGDGAAELLVVNNQDASKGLFRRSRLLTSGRVVCLTWQSLGPVARWETPKVSGHINDMALGDTDGDGGRELIYAVVAKLDGHQSYLVTHALTSSN
jgi:TolB-like protein